MAHIFPSPKEFLNHKQIVEYLIKHLPDKNLKDFRALERGELIWHHHGFGTWIRNQFGLWNEKNPHTMMQSPGPDSLTHPDQYSFTVMEMLWEELHKLEFIDEFTLAERRNKTS